MFETLREIWQALKARKKLALMPIAVILVLVGGLVVVLQGSAIAPFIYALF